MERTLTRFQSRLSSLPPLATLALRVHEFMTSSGPGCRTVVSGILAVLRSHAVERPAPVTRVRRR
jgi:hypothetical protein